MHSGGRGAGRDHRRYLQGANVCNGKSIALKLVKRPDVLVVEL